MKLRPPEHFVHGLDGPIAVVDGRICDLLNRMLGLDKFRVKVRGQDAQLDNTLQAIKVAALAYTAASGTGRTVAAQPETQPHSDQQQKTVSTTTAEKLLGISDRAVRYAIADKRIAAKKDDSGHYRITEDELRRYAASR